MLAFSDNSVVLSLCVQGHPAPCLVFVNDGERRRAVPFGDSRFRLVCSLETRSCLEIFWGFSIIQQQKELFTMFQNVRSSFLTCQQTVKSTLFVWKAQHRSMECSRESIREALKSRKKIIIREFKDSENRWMQIVVMIRKQMLYDDSKILLWPYYSFDFKGFLRK